MVGSLNLFEQQPALTTEIFHPGAVLLRGFALTKAAELLAAINKIIAEAPFRQMVVPGGRRMSAQLTNCGTFGWVADETGYRYVTRDPQSGLSWPAMPEVFVCLAESAARQAGWQNFMPDACLLNRYGPTSRMGLHQDKDERDFSHPIVSVSLGLTATFLFGGLRRSDPVHRIPLLHGDVVVWGGPARMRYHGIAPIKGGYHPSTGEVRLNLTLRKAS